ncbi:MAG: HD domain-containing protein [Firmicutes bacterium]|nr:HD domain-containing protein [Bacillota bacterium]
MFKRKLDPRERDLIEKIIEFVRAKHSREEGHDYSHVLEVCRWCMEIGDKIEEPVDPFIALSGALLHDIGRVGAENGNFHGLDGGARAEEFLESLIEDPQTILKITKIIVRHTPTSMIAAQTTEEKLVCDADTIERLGLMGMVRGIMGKKGSMKSILEDRIKKRMADYDKLYFDYSKKIAKPYYNETKRLVKILEKYLSERLAEIQDLQSYKILAGDES